MRKLSITRRLILLTVLTQVALTAAVVALAVYLTYVQLRSAFDAGLHGRATSIAALVRFSEDEHPHLIFDDRLVPPPLDNKDRDLYKIVSDGKVIATSPGWNGQVPMPRKANRTYWKAHVNRQPYRFIRLKDIPVLDSEGPDSPNSGVITVFYAASTREMSERIWWVAIFTCIGSLLLLSLATRAMVWAVRRGLSPLSQLAGSAARVTPQDWQLHAPPDALATVELLPLASAMDRMLATLQQAFTSQREFVANAAHELKTPIAVLKSTLQLALHQPRTAAEYRAQLQQALDDVGRLETLTHSMLRLARAEQLQESRLDEQLPSVDVSLTCEQSADRWRPLAESRAVRITVNAPEAPIEFRGEADDLELIWSNLLDNAVRYSPEGGEVRVSVSRDNGSVRVDVTDQGPGIGREQLEQIFSRFHRADPSRSRDTGGYGLGLAIAKAMVEAYGGTIQAESRAGAGTKFTVQLPAPTGAPHLP